MGCETNVNQISDLSVFDARTWSAARLKTIEASDPDSEIFKSLDGRYHFWINPSKDVQSAHFDPEGHSESRLYGVMRVDAENRMVSGDVFRDARHLDWVCSWVSEAVFEDLEPTGQDGWNLLAVSDLHIRKILGEDADPFGKMAVAIQGTAQGVTACRLVGIGTSGEAFGDYSATRFTLGRDAAFRDIALRTIIHSHAGEDGFLRKAARLAVGNDGISTLKETFSRTGSRVHWRGKPLEDHIDAEGQPRRSELDLLARHQWTEDPRVFSVLLTTKDAPTDGLLGRAFGLGTKAHMSRSRFAAVVYLKAVEESFGAVRGPRSDDPEYVCDLARHIRHYYIHELGHLMNLPHPWQRDAFATPDLPANPAARTWMNYGSRYPLGRLMEKSRQIAATPDVSERDLARQDSMRSLDGPMFEPGFAPLEERWIRHAPFNQIASGKRFFTESLNGALEMPKPWPRKAKQKKSQLNIWDTAQDDRGRTILSIQKKDILQLGGPAEHWQPVFGDVVYDIDQSILNSNEFFFTFQAPMLSLLVRAEFPNRRRPDVIRVVKPQPLPYAANFEGQVSAPPDKNWLGTRVAQTASATSWEDSDLPGHRRFRCKLPLLQKDFFEEFFPDLPHRQSLSEANRKSWPTHRFTFQAVLRMSAKAGGVSPRPFFSEKVTVHFTESELEQPDVLQDPNLPLLTGLLNFVKSGERVEDLVVPGRHVIPGTCPSHEFERPFADLVARIKATRASDEHCSQQLLDHLGSRLGVV